MNSNTKKFIYIIIILLLVLIAAFVFRYYQSKKISSTPAVNNKQTVKNVNSGWINVKNGLPSDFPNLPLVTADAVLSNRFENQSTVTTITGAKLASKSSSEEIIGEYKYTAANANVPLKDTAQQFYNSIMSKNSWNIKETGNTINASNKSSSVTITFTAADPSHTTVDINYIQKINAQ